MGDTEEVQVPAGQPGRGSPRTRAGRPRRLGHVGGARGSHDRGYVTVGTEGPPKANRKSPPWPPPLPTAIHQVVSEPPEKLAGLPPLLAIRLVGAVVPE